ncbi:hypothetical protein [Rudaeicoccus suwonensis]|uniref:hypothetical protein n=1 Tax=Rudaeicoccus suwonensis TaxID=657409 RepID=UPI0011A76B5F|nr:hypothetical protein [Rudaeicoccus suwonensis]
MSAFVGAWMPDAHEMSAFVVAWMPDAHEMSAFVVAWTPDTHEMSALVASAGVVPTKRDISWQEFAIRIDISWHRRAVVASGSVLLLAARTRDVGIGRRLDAGRARDVGIGRSQPA